MASIVFDNVGKIYPDGTRALEDLSLAVEDGEFMVFVGPSGCGKTTAMMMVAGLEDITSGQIRIGDRVVNDLEPRQRDIAMVFQNYALYPHMTVHQNLAFGLRMKRTPKPEIEERVGRIASVLGLADLLKRKPRHLSGGQRQRVAMGRAIVRDPQAFLMDEPLSNLDAKLRVQMRAEISRIQRQLGATTLYVTHDQVEAMTMGDRVAVLRKGRLQQLATPQELYERPVNLFVAGFIGSPEMNLIVGRLERREGGLELTIGDDRLAIEPDVLQARPALEPFFGKPIGVGIRPEHLQDARLVDESAGRTLRGKVELTEVLGSDLLVHFTANVEPLHTGELLEVAGDVDVTRLQEMQDESSRHETRFVGQLDTRSRFQMGEVATFAVNTEKIHYFDPETGSALRGAEG